MSVSASMSLGVLRGWLAAGLLGLSLHCGGSSDDPSQSPTVPQIADPEPEATPSSLPENTGKDVGSEGEIEIPDVGSAVPDEPDPLHGEVRAGDSLTAILGRAGLDDTEAARVVIALGKVMDPATIRAGTHYDVE